MGIFTEKAFGIQCDACKEIFVSEYTGYSLFIDESDAKESAMDNGWAINDDKCYCPNCHEIDEDDNVIVKETKL